MQPISCRVINELVMGENSIVFSSANQITSRYSSTNHRLRRSQLISAPVRFLATANLRKDCRRKNLAGKNIQCMTVKRRRMISKKFQGVGN